MRPFIPDTRGEALVGLLLSAAGVATILGANQLPGGSGGIPGPDIFPMALGVLLVPVGLAVAISALRKAGDKPVDLFEPRAMLFIVLIAAYAIAFETIGFVVSTFVFLLVAFIAVGRAGWRPALVVALVATGLMFAIFLKILSVGLPEGLLG